MNARYDMVACYVVRPGERPGDAHEFLQLRRAPGRFMEGIWSTVAGGVETGETAWAAALRELREETAIVPLAFYQLDTVNIFYLAATDTLWHCPGFCAVVGRDVDVRINDEHDGVRWIDRSRVDRDFLWPGERAQVAELCREILDDGPAKPHLRIALP